MTGWGTLVDIRKENLEAERAATAAPPVACPICGEVLQVRGDVRNCPWGHWRSGAARP